MKRRQSKKPSAQVHHSVAVRELVDRDSDYDTSTSAWAEFDQQITTQLAELEQRLSQYFTPNAFRNKLGR